MSRSSEHAQDLINTIVRDLKDARLPLLSHREGVILFAIGRWAAHMALEYTDRKIDLLETEIKMGASRLRPDPEDSFNE
jgi:hypothetical protein